MDSGEFNLGTGYDEVEAEWGGGGLQQFCSETAAERRNRLKV